MTAALPSQLPDYERERLEAGALRHQLSKLASCLPDELDEAQHDALALLSVTSAGEEVSDRLFGYQLAIVQQHHEIAELNARLGHAISVLSCEWDDCLIRCMADDFAAGRGSDALRRLMDSLKKSALRLPRYKYPSGNSCAVNLIKH